MPVLLCTREASVWVNLVKRETLQVVLVLKALKIATKSVEAALQ